MKKLLNVFGHILVTKASKKALIPPYGKMPSFLGKLPVQNNCFFSLLPDGFLPEGLAHFGYTSSQKTYQP
ncbi:hypothetical protein QNI22_34100 [Cytophagaceae bacterium BD1B2-1]|uniref:Uncharacterized protein n=1 Tax=Xanthocytophaga agilis TaxID=3048010 RepID=A0AAE3R8L1_9BACT|nr:hypothetical protein [Xanthocytophaga agilis]